MPPCSTRRARPPRQPPPGLGARPISSLDHHLARSAFPAADLASEPARRRRRRICRPRAPSNPRGAAGRSAGNSTASSAVGGRRAGANRQGRGGGERQTRKGNEARRRDEMKGNGSGAGTGVRAPLSKPIAEGTQPAAVVAPPDAAGSEIRATWTAGMGPARVKRGYKAVSSPRWGGLASAAGNTNTLTRTPAGRQRVRIPPLPGPRLGIPGLGGVAVWAITRGLEGSGQD
ncbi:uncharacterized protein [Miscanthus floridulus]|uniref:uncharacterized protein n=1 Tax=Miscanthus floridulus TaxID=154761 RepID=UPI00345996F8